MLVYVGPFLISPLSQLNYCNSKDADQVLEDVVWKGFYHEDVRSNQFALAPNPIRCPRHKRTHKVFVLDFELVYRVPPIHNDRDLARWKQYNLMRLNPGLRRHGK